MKAQIRIKSLQDEEYANPASVKSNQGEQEMQEVTKLTKLYE